MNIEGPWDDVQKMDLSLVHDEHGDVSMEMPLEDAQKKEVSLVNDEYRRVLGRRSEDGNQSCLR